MKEKKKRGCYIYVTDSCQLLSIQVKLSQSFLPSFLVKDKLENKQNETPFWKKTCWNCHLLVSKKKCESLYSLNTTDTITCCKIYFHALHNRILYLLSNTPKKNLIYLWFILFFLVFLQLLVLEAPLAWHFCTSPTGSWYCNTSPSMVQNLKNLNKCVRMPTFFLLSDIIIV